MQKGVDSTFVRVWHNMKRFKKMQWLHVSQKKHMLAFALPGCCVIGENLIGCGNWQMTKLGEHEVQQHTAGDILGKCSHWGKSIR